MIFARRALFFLLATLVALPLTAVSAAATANTLCNTGNNLNGCPAGCWSPGDNIFVQNDEIPCIPVGPGFYSPADSFERFACEAGHYSFTEDAAECTPCSPGTMGTPHGTACIDCPTGFYQDEYGQAICKSCHSARYKGEGANAVTHDGYCLLLALESESNNGDIVDTRRNLSQQQPPICTNTRGTCEAGCWNDDGIILDNGKRLCVAVEPGYYSPYNSNERFKCQDGYVSAEHQSESCTPCRPGSLAHSSGTGCMPCPRGTYQDEYGGKVCLQCNPNMYSGPGANKVSPDGHCLRQKSENDLVSTSIRTERRGNLR